MWPWASTDRRGGDSVRRRPGDAAHRCGARPRRCSRGEPQLVVSQAPRAGGRAPARTSSSESPSIVVAEAVADRRGAHRDPCALAQVNDGRQSDSSAATRIVSSGRNDRPFGRDAGAPTSRARWPAGSQSNVSSSHRAARLVSARARACRGAPPTASPERRRHRPRRRRPAGPGLRPGARAWPRARRPASRPGPGPTMERATVGRVGRFIRARDRTRDSKGDGEVLAGQRTAAPIERQMGRGRGPPERGGACSQLTSVPSPDTVRAECRRRRTLRTVSDPVPAAAGPRPPSEDPRPSAAWTTRCSARRAARTAISSYSPATTSGPVPSANAPRVRTAREPRSRAPASPAGPSRCRSSPRRSCPRPPGSVAAPAARCVQGRGVEASGQARPDATSGPPSRSRTRSSSRCPRRRARRPATLVAVSSRAARFGTIRIGESSARRPSDPSSPSASERSGSPASSGSDRRPTSSPDVDTPAGHVRPPHHRSRDDHHASASPTRRIRSRSPRPAGPTTGRSPRRLRADHRDEPGRGRPGWHDRADRDGRSNADRRLDRDRDADGRAHPNTGPDRGADRHAGARPHGYAGDPIRQDTPAPVPRTRRHPIRPTPLAPDRPPRTVARRRAR